MAEGLYEAVASAATVTAMREALREFEQRIAPRMEHDKNELREEVRLGLTGVTKALEAVRDTLAKGVQAELTANRDRVDALNLRLVALETTIKGLAETLTAQIDAVSVGTHKPEALDAIDGALRAMNERLDRIEQIVAAGGLDGAAVHAAAPSIFERARAGMSAFMGAPPAPPAPRRAREFKPGPEEF